jgi:hypothetical protein
MLDIIKELFWSSVKFGFKLTACYLPGKLNIVSDCISRLHNFESACEASLLLFDGENFPINCVGHMTENAFASLQEAWYRV